MNNSLISQLSKLKLQKSCIKRNLDRNYYDAKIREKMFNELKEVNKEIDRIKFKIMLEKEKKNGNNYTS